MGHSDLSGLSKPMAESQRGENEKRERGGGRREVKKGVGKGKGRTRGEGKLDGGQPKEVHS